jgi:outer membrane murein-binding lipoprotein Lpp
MPDRDIAINSRTLVLVAALLGGGTIGGGAISLSTKLPDDVRENIADTKRMMESLRSDIGAINIKLNAMTKDQEMANRDAERINSTLLKHEDRIRSLEDRVPRVRRGGP